MKKIIFILLIVGNIYSQNIDEIVPDFSPEETSQIEKAFGQFISSTTVFTGRNSASTGNFSFDNDQGDFSVINLPYTHYFGTQDDSYRIQLRGAIGYLNSESKDDTFYEISKELPAEYLSSSDGLDLSKDQATTISVGTGVEFKLAKNLRITPAFDMLWTHVRSEYKFNNLVSELIGIKYNRDLFNTSTEAISYSPSLAIDYTYSFDNGNAILPSLVYTHIFSDDLWSKSNYADFSIESKILKLGLTADIPLTSKLFNRSVKVQPYVKRTGLFGAIRESLEESAIYDIGSNLVLDFSKDKIINNIYFGAAYLVAEDLDGYRIDFGFKF